MHLPLISFLPRQISGEVILTELRHLLDVSAVAGHGAMLAALLLLLFFFFFFFFFLL